MKLRTHLAASAEPIRLRGVDPKRGTTGYLKPAGLWYEVDGDWRRWITEEGIEWAGSHLHTLDLADCTVLRITNTRQFDAFQARYVTVPAWPGADTFYPDWSRLANECDGLEISPYRWNRRLDPHTMWYYGWDCASGVIWRPRNASLTYSGPWLPMSVSASTLAG